MACEYLVNGCCDALRQALGWKVGVSAQVCRQCEAEGGDPLKRKGVGRRIAGCLRARILDAAKPVWDAHTAETGLAASAKKFLERTGENPEAIIALLDEAVAARGLDPAEAAECVTMLEAQGVAFDGLE